METKDVSLSPMEAIEGGEGEEVERTDLVQDACLVAPTALDLAVRLSRVAILLAVVIILLAVGR